MRKQITLVLLVLMIGLFGGSLAEESFLRINSFSEGMAAVQNLEGLWGYIDRSGKIVIPCEWEEAGEFNGGNMAVLMHPDSWLLHANGTDTLRFLFPKVSRRCRTMMVSGVLLTQLEL